MCKRGSPTLQTGLLVQNRYPGDEVTDWSTNSRTVTKEMVLQTGLLVQNRYPGDEDTDWSTNSRTVT